MRFEFINFLNAHDKFRDAENNKELDSFDIVKILNHYEEVLKDLEARGAFAEIKYDHDEDDYGETVKQVIIDDEKYIDIEYFARIKADLEAKLAKKDEEITKRLRLQDDMFCEELKAKLAESETARKKAYQEGFLQKQFDKDMEIMQLKQQLSEKEEQLNDLEQQCLICNKDQENERLKQQLAEKDLKIIELETKLNLKDKGTNV